MSSGIAVAADQILPSVLFQIEPQLLADAALIES